VLYAAAVWQSNQARVHLYQLHVVNTEEDRRFRYGNLADARVVRFRRDTFNAPD